MEELNYYNIILQKQPFLYLLPKIELIIRPFQDLNLP